MKRIFTLVLLALTISSFAQNRSMQLRHTMTAEEAKLSHLIGKGFEATDPPPGEVRNIAEFEPMEGVLITYHNGFGIGYNLISALSNITTVTTVVATETLKNMIISNYTNNGVNLDNCIFLIAPNNSVWTRDYGPWYVAYGEDQIGIIDKIYNRPRPLDDVIPQVLADELGLEWFGMDLITAGGNYMTDGQGMSLSTNLTEEENPDLTNAEIDQMVLDYLGVEQYNRVDDPTGMNIQHIDTWGKYLDVDKILLPLVPTTHPHYDEIEATVDYMETLTSSYGTPYQIYRVNTPNNEPYTNSLIINDHVFIAVTGSEWDDDAIATYQEAMPGYTVVGMTGSWLSSDALHCRTKGLADDEMLYISHMPLLGNQAVQTAYTIDVEITAYSGAAVVNDEVKVYYRNNYDDWSSVVMTPLGGKHYQATIPAGVEGSMISYYISAQDAIGKVANHPYIGAPDPHVFYVGEELFPDISLITDPISVTIAQDQNTTLNLAIENSGQAILQLGFAVNTMVLDSVDYSVSDSPLSFESNTYTEEGWEDIDITDEGEVGDLKLIFDWITDAYPEDGSIHLESPNGTMTTLAAGIDQGTYELSTGAFNSENQDGNWKLWIEDSYGDGNLQMTNVTFRLFSDSGLPEWLTLSETEAYVSPSESYSLELNFNSTALEEGEYTGLLTLTTNVETNPIIEIPLTLIVDNSVNIETNPFINKLQFANPFTNQLHLSYHGENAKYQIVDVSGRVLSKGQLSNNLDINTENWQPGIYFLNVVNQSGKAVYKLVRQ